jgi:hypothetical protein
MLYYAMLCDYMQRWKDKKESARDYEMYEERKDAEKANSLLLYQTPNTNPGIFQHVFTKSTIN